jgi:hypothetical protein
METHLSKGLHLPSHFERRSVDVDQKTTAAIGAEIIDAEIE